MKTIRFSVAFLCLSMTFAFSPAYGQDTQKKETIESLNKAIEKLESKIKDLETKIQNKEADNEGSEKALRELNASLKAAVDELNKAIEEIEDDLEDAFEDENWSEKDNPDGEDDGEAKVKIKLKKPVQSKRTRTFFQLNFGPTWILNQQSAPEDISQPTFKPWKSFSAALGLVFSTRLGGSSSIVHLNYGLLWNMTELETNDDLQLTIANGQPLYTDSPYSSSLRKSALRRHSLRVPLQLRFGKNKEESFNVIVGGYGGLRLYGVQHIDFKSTIGEQVRTHLRNDYEMTMFQYGTTLAVGQRWWQIYADYELSEMFNSNPNHNWNNLNVGVQFLF